MGHMNSAGRHSLPGISLTNDTAAHSLPATAACRHAHPRAYCDDRSTCKCRAMMPLCLPLFGRRSTPLCALPQPPAAFPRPAQCVLYLNGTRHAKRFKPHVRVGGYWTYSDAPGAYDFRKVIATVAHPDFGHSAAPQFLLNGEQASWGGQHIVATCRSSTWRACEPCALLTLLALQTWRCCFWRRLAARHGQSCLSIWVSANRCA